MIKKLNKLLDDIKTHNANLDKVIESINNTLESVNTPISLEDHAAMRLAGESVECLCDEYASLIVELASENKRLKLENDLLKREVFEDE